MNTTDLRGLFDYNDWANARWMAALASLQEGEWTRHLGGSFPSLRETTRHIVIAEWLWLRRWRGESPTSLPDWFEAATLAVLRDRLDEVRADRDRWLGGLPVGDAERMIEVTLLSGASHRGPLAVLLQHLVNHSSYHRGQLANMMRRIGRTPPQTDLFFWAVERGTVE